MSVCAKSKKGRLSNYAKHFSKRVGIGGNLHINMPISKKPYRKNNIFLIIFSVV